MLGKVNKNALSNPPNPQANKETIMNALLSYYNRYSKQSNPKIELYLRALQKMPIQEQVKILDCIDYLCDVFPAMGKISALELIGSLGLFLCR
jgi:hypothetical protein